MNNEGILRKLDKIDRLYDGDADTSRVNWASVDLAQVTRILLDRIKKLEDQIYTLEMEKCQ